MHIAIAGMLMFLLWFIVFIVELNASEPKRSRRRYYDPRAHGKRF